MPEANGARLAIMSPAMRKTSGSSRAQSLELRETLDRIDEARAQLGITQNELERRLRAKTGSKTQGYVANLRTRKRLPNASTMSALASTLNVSMQWLSSGQGAPRTQDAADHPELAEALALEEARAWSPQVVEAVRAMALHVAKPYTCQDLARFGRALTALDQGRDP
jgi:transcriptional regulator with XRE-family HTH domain